jgi:plastocyanin
MPLVRLGVATPELNTNTVLASFTSNYLASVIVTNRAATATPQTKVTIWVVPANSTLESQYAYMCANLLIGVGSTFETFRFAVNPGDQLFVRSTTENTSFSCTGILQDDSALPQNLPQVFTNKVIRGIENTVLLDKGTTAERRTNAEIGYVRFNTETSLLEVKTSSSDWFSIGRVGPEGPAGADGPAGPAGADGPAGTSLVILGVSADVESLPSESNSVGDIYIVEADGEAYVWDGTNWVSIGTITGPAGEDGATGPAGDPGPTGPTGADGADGADGTSVVILGVVATTEDLPSESNSVGDIYIVEADGEAYVWDGDSWESIGNITGPAGPSGPEGPTGPAGDVGPTGPAGEGAITVATTTEEETFVGLYEDATGTIGGKTNSGITYNASSETLTVTAVKTGSIEAPEDLVGTYTINSPTTITLNPVSETINTAPIKLVNKTSSQLSTLVASVGAIVWNSTESLVSVYDGENWVTISGSEGSIGPTGPTGPTGASGSATFNGTTDATLAGLTINEIAYSAITRLEVTNSGSTAYLFNNQYSGNNPTIYAISGTTIAFNLNVTGHPFLIRVSSGGSNYDTGLIHVDTDGTVVSGSSAQGKVTGTLYWQVPAAISGNYVYQCSIHSGMVGTITIKDISAI